MNFRLQQFLAAENITQAQFADEIGVARASVSHIIAGRNKPGFDFIQNMSRRYPDLNLEWLIQGKGRMYKEERADRPVAAEPADGQLFANIPATPEPPASPAVETPRETSVPAPLSATKQEKQVVENKQDSIVLPKATQQPKDRKITRIVVFYDDNTYQELREA